MKVNVVSSKLIKPCTPTPPNLNKYKLSLLDEKFPPMNAGVILFYPPISTPTNIILPKQTRIHHMRQSLAKILPKFYILAGRYIKNENVIDCGDQGVLFIEAEAVEVELIDLVKNRRGELLNDLLPSKFHQVYESPTDPLLSIQITHINKCGGLVISVTVSHRIFDASSLETFISDWSNAASNNNNNNATIIIPTFETPTLFPSTNPGGLDDGPLPFTPPDPCIAMKRFSFDKDAIRRLRSKLNSRNINISRVRAVCAVIAKAMMGVDRSRGCVLSQLVNMRGRTIPPIPKHCCGNLTLLALTRCLSVAELTTNDIGFEELVRILGEGLDKAIDDCAEMFSPSGRGWQNIISSPLVSLFENVTRGEVSLMTFSDWSKFGFYEADFGWGETPVGTGIGVHPRDKSVVLMDNKEGDGIEAWVCLNRDDMAYFEQHEDIKLYTNGL